MKKDIKKSSYYVWFLGAEEAKGLRGSDFMVPVIRHLVEREKEVEPFKVTLQISHKGLKIIQNVPVGYPTTKATKNGKTEVVKHFIPHHAITSVYQEEDIVSCILLLFNPVTKCPVHVHAYRCDSVETAEILCGQLQTLIERPENQKKLEEIESRLKAKGLVSSTPSKLRKVHSPASGSSDGRSSARESDLSGGSSNSDRLSGFGSQESRIANLYDSLAAELKEKLCTGSQQNHAPILLPPRDYDTVHRQKGNLSGIDFRRCLNLNIVGMNAAKNKKNDLLNAQASGSKQHLVASPRTKVGSSGGSSGIGSDHAPSPDQETENRFLDNQSTSGKYNKYSNLLILIKLPEINKWR
ncbi:hypothetical protein PGB90_004414 [Kerria lacca]